MRKREPHIPLELLGEIIKDPFYEKCCISGKTPVQLHHNLLYAYRQVNEKWCILPLHKSIHDEVHKYQKELNAIMLNRATYEQLKPYSKIINYVKMKHDNKNNLLAVPTQV